jgi:hypothetical protein
MSEEKTAEELAAEEAAALEAKKGEEDEAQKLRSWLGRVEKTTKDHGAEMAEIKGSLQEIASLLQTQHTPKAEPNAVNERLREMLLGDNPMEGLEFYDNIKTEAQKNLSALKQKRLNEAFGKMKDHPMLSEDVKKEAQSMVNNGIDPGTAVQMAVLKAENTQKDGILTKIKEQNPTILDMLGPGNPKAGVKPEGKLPPTYEKACQKGIADGTFKDREEYIKLLDPNLRQSLGIE